MKTILQPSARAVADPPAKASARDCSFRLAKVFIPPELGEESPDKRSSGIKKWQEAFGTVVQKWHPIELYAKGRHEDGKPDVGAVNVGVTCHRPVSNLGEESLARGWGGGEVASAKSSRRGEATSKLTDEHCL